MEASINERVLEGRKYGLIWFGAAISLAEIEAGLYCRGSLSAVILGHLLGGAMLFLAGLIGARTRQNGMECTKAFFGTLGMRFFAVVNVLQLIGWTAVMISQGADAAHEIIPSMPLWSLASILGILVAIWIFIGLRSFSIVSACSIVLLLVLVAILSVRIATSNPVMPIEDGGETSDFWAIFEMSLAMPLSWLPLISDYTKESKAPVTASATSAIVYTIGSIWMYMLGIGLASLGQDNIAVGIKSMGLGAGALLIVLISTTTTTFLDAYSAGESSKTLVGRLNPKLVGVAVCALGVGLSVCGIMDHYINFLYLISSLLAPMAVVMLTSYLLPRKPSIIANAVAYVAGFATYQGCLAFPRLSPIGATMASIVVAFALAATGGLLLGKPKEGAVRN